MLNCWVKEPTCPQPAGPVHSAMHLLLKIKVKFQKIKIKNKNDSIDKKKEEANFFTVPKQSLLAVHGAHISSTHVIHTCKHTLMGTAILVVNMDIIFVNSLFTKKRNSIFFLLLILHGSYIMHPEPIHLPVASYPPSAIACSHSPPQ